MNVCGARPDGRQTALREPAGELVQRLGDDVVEGPQPAPLGIDDARLPQHLEVVRDRRLRQFEERYELADADLAGVLPEHVDELEANRVAERLGDRRHPLRLVSFDVGVDDRLTARLAWGALLLRGEPQIDRHQYTFID